MAISGSTLTAIISAKPKNTSGWIVLREVSQLRPFKTGQHRKTSEEGRPGRKGRALGPRRGRQESGRHICLPRQVLQLKKPVTGHSQAGTWDLALVRNCGKTTCGNQDVRGGIPLPVDLDRGLRTVCKCCIAVDDFYVGLG